MFLFQTIGRPVVAKAAPKPAESKDVLKLEEVLKMKENSCLELHNINTFGTAMSNRLPKYDQKSRDEIQIAARKKHTEFGCVAPPEVAAAPDPLKTPVNFEKITEAPDRWRRMKIYLGLASEK